jgi:hypothetical protein
MPVSETARWNVVAVMAVVLTFALVGVSAAALLLGHIDFQQFNGYVSPFVAGWLGFVARMLGEQK